MRHRKVGRRAAGADPYGVIDGESNSTGLNAEEPGEKTYALTCSESTASILLHPKFANISEAEQIVAKALLDGTRLFDLVWRHKTKLMMSSTEPAAPENWHEKETLEDAIKTVVQSDAGKLLIEKIRKGVTSYNAERLEWAETSYARSLSAAASGLSQIDTPPGAPPGDFRKLAHDKGGGEQDGVRALLGNQKNVDGLRRRIQLGQGSLRRRLKTSDKQKRRIFSRRFKIRTLQMRARTSAISNELNRNIFRILNEADSKIFVILDNHPIPRAVGVLGELHKANIQIRRRTGNADCIIFPGINNFNPPVKLISNLFLRFK